MDMEARPRPGDAERAERYGIKPFKVEPAVLTDAGRRLLAHHAEASRHKEWEAHEARQRQVTELMEQVAALYGTWMDSYKLGVKIRAPSSGVEGF